VQVEKTITPGGFPRFSLQPSLLSLVIYQIKTKKFQNKLPLPTVSFDSKEFSGAISQDQPEG
jgi:hypothetical protein